MYKTYGNDSPQALTCSDGYHFEPSIAQRIFQEMIAEYKNKITIRTLRQFDSDPENLVLFNNKIKKIKVTNRNNQQTEWYEASIFIDATYEGDLAAAAGIPYRIGRESQTRLINRGGKTLQILGGTDRRKTPTMPEIMPCKLITTDCV